MKSEQPKDSPDRRVVAGLQPVREALRVHGNALSHVLVERQNAPRLSALLRFAKDRGVQRVQRVSRAELDRLTAGTMHQGAVAFAPPLELHPPTQIWERPSFVALALDKIQDPQNFGAIIRSSVALADADVIWGEHSSAPLTTATFRASAGAVEHARLCRVPSLTAALQDAAGHGALVVGLEASAEQTLSELDLTGPTVLVLGAEHSGLSKGVRKTCTHLASLAPLHELDSLNVSVAAGITLYELARQRRSKA